MNPTRRNVLHWMGLTTGISLAAPYMPTIALGAEPAADDAGTLAQSGQNRWQIAAAKKKVLAKDIVWLTHEPLDFLLRRGDHSDDEASHYEQMCQPSNIQRMADAGVKWGRIFFYKGFGLEYERPHIGKAKAIADQMHNLGMKVSLYFGGTMFIETFYQEIPEAKNWEQRDQNNQPVPYGSQAFRHYACPNEPAYLDYCKKVLTVAINDLHADEIAFDNIMLQSEPKSCRCPRCMKAFAEFLRQRYPTPEAVTRRFGLPNVDCIRVNEWESSEQPNEISQLEDPVLQEWTRFRCQSLANYARGLYDIVKSLNPDTAVLLNIKGVYSFNRYWSNAVYHPMYTDHVDLIAFDTGGYNEHIDAVTGALISQIRSYKMARHVNSGCEDSFADDLRAANHMAFGFQKAVAGLAPAPFGSGAYNVFTPLLEFFREYNDRYYTGTQPIADVAVLRSWASIAYGFNATNVPATLMEQVLIQHKIPFDLLFDEQLEHLERYQAVILAGQDSISDEQADTLLAYVRAGGTLITTGNTARYNQWRENRHKNPFLPARTDGKGKIVYIPEITPAVKRAKVQVAAEDPEPGASATKAERMSPPQWVLPQNHEEIAKTIVDALPHGLSLSSDAPLTTVAELLAREETKETIAHFINFNRRMPTPAFAVTLRKQFPGSIHSVQCFSAENSDPTLLAFVDVGDYVKVTVPGMPLYSMVVVR